MVHWLEVETTDIYYLNKQFKVLKNKKKYKETLKSKDL